MRSAVVAVVAAAALLTTSCSAEEKTAPKPDLPTETPALWNPCDGLDPAAVGEAFGTTFSSLTGTADAPQCSFVPQDDGAPALDVNYQLFPGTLAELIESFGSVPDGAATRVNGPGLDAADDARIIVDVNDGTLAITGFVQNGELVQLVNALDPEPFDRAGVRRGVRTVLAALATHASDSGLS